MSNLKEFTKELEELCTKYGYIISGKTTSGSIHIGKCTDIECGIRSEFEDGAFIICKEK